MHLDGWTLLLQALNLLVLIALLRWLFYRPLLAMIDARRQATENERNQASASQREAEQRSAALEVERAAVETGRAQAIADARHQVDGERDRTLEQARAEADRLLADAKRRIASERQQASRAICDEAATLAIALATRLLASAPDGHGDAGFIGELLRRLEATPGAERDAWFAAETVRSVTLATAHPLELVDRQAAADRLRRALGDELRVEFASDPALIAGAELRFAHGVLARHWAAELATARKAMRAEAPA